MPMRQARNGNAKRVRETRRSAKKTGNGNAGRDANKVPLEPIVAGALLMLQHGWPAEEVIAAACEQVARAHA